MVDHSEDSEPESGSPLSADQVELIKESWQELAPRLAEMASGFYDRLFKLKPGLKPMFESVDIETQGKKFIDTINFVVKGLDHFELLGPAIGELGSRHAGYAVKDSHYDSMRIALLETLDVELGDAFDSETRCSWELTYDALAKLMRAGPSDNTMTVSAID